MTVAPGEPGYVTPPHVVNGELAARVFELIELTDPQPGRQSLELAYLYFLEQFRKVYISETAKQMNDRSQVNERLASLLKCRDENEILGKVINKIGKNLQHRCAFETYDDGSVVMRICPL